MPFYVYILQSAFDKSFYKGFSENPLQRLAQHNNGESHYTSLKRPWKLVYIEMCADKRSALIREKTEAFCLCHSMFTLLKSLVCQKRYLRHWNRFAERCKKQIQAQH